MIKTKGKNNQLEILKVIQKLEVGPVKVDKRRLVVPYIIYQDNTQDSIEHIFCFEEDVFDPNEPESLNLASMIGAQVAINYGLFCDEIAFIGLYDHTDHKFIRDMMKNTAQEIFVKKFLEHNPFIQGPAAKLPAIKIDNYSQAKVKFKNQDLPSGEKFKPKQLQLSGWTINQNRYTILSSGGKDSLLSFGLLRELGVETHPIFINESGRHWFTALNAYRYFLSNIKNTTKVWTNSDRIFNWMLRHLPFVRQDFKNIRSDEYPIRLWSVAVFLFGALPVMRKRGIGHLVIGDEFDTTVKLSYKGITHYNGLYDQSKYFDDILSQYFSQKEWGVNQFSLLRQLSEILIEKILVERFSDLQQHQVSCHATHTSGNRVRPCGKCEKCRRIVGMLVALDADPTRCGYSEDQITSCFKNLTEKGIHQEKEAIQHLAYLLKQKGVLDNAKLGPVKGKNQPEVLKLRFDPEKSPINGIPVLLRAHIYKIFLEHSTGAIRHYAHGWNEFNPISTPDLFKAYPYETNEKLKKPLVSIMKSKSGIDKPFLLSTLTWPEARERFKEVDIAILPVGSIEQHGTHLPLDTDAFDAEHLANEVTAACSNPKPIVLPLISYGVSYHHEDFSGTLSVSPETLSNMVYDIGLSAAKHGVKKLVIFNGHGGNTPALQFAAQKINRDTSIFTCVETGETSDADVIAISETPNDVHAGEIETSTSLAVRPDMVRKDKVRKFVPKFSSRFLDFSSKRSVEWYTRTVKISKTGVLGDPTKASSKKGEKMWSMMVMRLVEFIEVLKSLSLNEIYQRRY
jgi:creatinine amidohydrolase/Fe(II)-dependent formamide hydrolase-like protein